MNETTEDEMLKIVFKNLESSSLIRWNVQRKMNNVLAKFPSLFEHRTTLTIEMQNSPKQAGPDLFTVSSMINGKLFKNLKIKRSAGNLYVAVAKLVDGLNQLLGEENDRRYKKYKKNKNVLNHRSILAS